jgi:hypothetical protein
MPHSRHSKTKRICASTVPLTLAIFVLEPGLVIGLSIYRKLYLVKGATLCELQDEGWSWLFANTVDFDYVLMTQHHTENK